MRALRGVVRILLLTALMMALMMVPMTPMLAMSPASAQPSSTPAAVSAAPAPGFSTAQRSEIVDIVRAAMKADPSILRDAIAALQAADAGDQAAAARTAIGRVGPALARSPGDPIAGNPDGDVTVVEFYDLRCPYCRRMLPIVAELLAKDHGIRLVYKDIPVLGPASVLGARAVVAAMRQGAYFALQRAVMSGDGQITEASLQEQASRSGLDWGRLQRDMQSREVLARINANLTVAHELGIEGTPTFVVGSRILPGAVPIEDLQAAVAAARANKG